jgi:hypothetical protein
MPTFKYALRYAPLLLLALILIPWHVENLNSSTVINAQASTVLLQTVIENSPYREGSALYNVIVRSPAESWAVGGTFELEPADDGNIQRVKPTAGMIMRYTPTNQWQQVATTPLPLFSIAFSGDQNGWAVGYGGTMVHYDGKNWTPVASPANLQKRLYDIVLPSATSGWAVGEAGTILRYDGQHWAQVTSPTKESLNSIAMVSPTEGWAVGANSTMLHLRDGVWQSVKLPVAGTLNDISMLSKDEGWAVGAPGLVLHYRAGNWGVVCIAACSTGYTDGSEQNYNLTNIAMATPQSGWITYQMLPHGGFLSYQGEVWQDVDQNAFPGKDGYNQYNNYNLLFNGNAMITQDSGWAVGRINSDGIRGTAMIFQYRNGQWKQVYQA